MVKGAIKPGVIGEIVSAPFKVFQDKRLTAADRLVFAYLYSIYFADVELRNWTEAIEVWMQLPIDDDKATACGLSSRTIYKSIAHLVSQGLIEKDRIDRSQRIAFRITPAWRT